MRMLPFFAKVFLVCEDKLLSSISLYCSFASKLDPSSLAAYWESSLKKR